MHSEQLGSIAVAVALILASGVAVAIATPARPAQQAPAVQQQLQETANVTVENGTTGGEVVVIDEVSLSMGGYVAVYEGDIGNGNATVDGENLLGHSQYLPAGTHENVTVTLVEPLAGPDTALNGSDGDTNTTDDTGTTVTAVVHHDSHNGNEVFDYLITDGEVDFPYTTMDDETLSEVPVHDVATLTVSEDVEDEVASVSASDQEADGFEVTVDSVTLSHGGFVVVHGEDGAVVGVSEYLVAGTHRNVTVTLARPVESLMADGETGDNQTATDGNQSVTLTLMPHLDTNSNGVFDWLSNESVDAPYTRDGAPVTTDVQMNATADNATTTTTTTAGNETTTTEGNETTTTAGNETTTTEDENTES